MSKRFRRSFAAVLLLAVLAAGPSMAQHAPGEDPVQLKVVPAIQARPTAPEARSQGLDPNQGLPAWLRARVARYEARAFATDTSGVITDNDVVATSNTTGVRKSCVQEVGSNTVASGAGNRYGPSSGPQVVVLRGDLVNVCK